MNQKTQRNPTTKLGQNLIRFLSGVFNMAELQRKINAGFF